MRKLLIAVVVIVILVIAAVLVVPHLIDVNQYRGQIQAELQKRLNRPVQLGNMNLSVIPLAVQVDNVSIGDDPTFRSNVPFAQVQRLDVHVKLFPLLAQNIEVSSLSLERPKIELIRNTAGVWNFASLGHNSTAPQANQAPPSQPPQAQQPAKPSPASQAGSQGGFELGELQIKDGQIAVTDYQKHQSRAVYDHIDLTLKDYAPNSPFSLDVTAHLPGKGTQTLQLSGKGGPINDTQLVNTPFKGEVKFNEVSLAGAQKFLNTQALENSDAVITGSTDFSTGGGKASAKGSLKLNDAVIHGVQVGYPINADFNVADDLNTDVIQISQFALKLGSTPLSINGTVNSRPTPMIVDVNVSANNASIQEAARLASAFGVAFNPNTKISGQVTANVHAQGPTDHLALNGNVNGRSLEVTGSDIPQPVKVPSIDLAMTPQEIRSNSFTATSGATTLAGQIALSQYTTPSPNIDATLKTVNGKVEELLSIAKAYGVSAVEGTSGSGAVSLDVHATGPIKNTNGMNFSGTGVLQNASLKVPSLTQPLNVRNANLQFTQNSANLTNLAASLGSTNATGNLSVSNFQAPNLRFALNADMINVAELQKITGGSNAAPAKKTAANWNLIEQADAAPAPAKPGFLESATGSGTVAVGTIIYDKTELTNVRSNVNLNHGVIQLSPLTAQVYGGQINGAISIDQRQPVATYAVNAKLTGADANRLLTAVGNSKDTLSGTLNANVNQTFSTPPSGDVTQTLNGPFSFTLTNGKLMKVDLLNELSKIGKFGGGGAKGYTAISQMSGTFDVRNGVAQTNDLKAALDVGTMAAQGMLNLVNETLNMHVTAVLSKGYSQSVGGTGVGGYLNTALANKQGELVLPVIITGTMSHPMVGPDVQKIAQMKVDNLLPTAAGVLGGKNASVGGIVGSLLGGQQGQPAAKPGQQPNQQQNLNNSINNALGGLLGGGKKNPH
jgi:uncharacterized protein involved in outer membrane biogenesis